jgi:hypothetical protein
MEKERKTVGKITEEECPRLSQVACPAALPSPLTYLSRQVEEVKQEAPPPCTPSPLGQFGTQVEDLRDGLCMQVMNRKTDIWQ